MTRNLQGVATIWQPCVDELITVTTSSTEDSTTATEEFDHTEGVVFRSMYTSKTTEDIQGLLNAIYPDFGKS